MSTAKPIGSKCPLGKYTYKEDGHKDNICDGLCNNCGLNFTPDRFTKFYSVSGINNPHWWNDYWDNCDYEEVILQRQEEWYD